MVTGDPATQDSFATDLSAALQVATAATTQKTCKRANTIFSTWETFCREHSRQPTLSDVPAHEDKLCYLLVFGLRYR